MRWVRGYRERMATTTTTGTDGRPATGYPKGRARRSEIVRVASSQFAERGFDGATMLDIAAACHISRAGLLHHFPDKERLLEAVLQARDDEDRQRFAPYVAERSDGIGVLRGIVDLAEHNRLVPGLIELFVRLSAEALAPDHPAHRYFTQRYGRIRSGTERALRAAADAGLLAPDLAPEDAAMELTALMDGLQEQWLFDRDVDMAQHVRRAVGRLLSADGRAAFDRFRPAGD